MTPLQKIRTSFTTKLSLWVTAFVVATSGVVLFLLASFSREVIRNETVDTTLQALENMALRIDNTLRQSEMTARLQGERFRVNRGRVDRLLEESRAEDMLRKSLPGIRLYVTRRDSTHLDAFITGAESGYRQLVNNDQELFIFTQPLADRQFCLTAVCPAKDMVERYSRMHNLLLNCGVGCILVLLYILYLVIARHLRPLHLLADAAQDIAAGNLDTMIPESHYQHEAGRLQSSLKKMQESLRAYMDEMQQKQATLSVHNTELQAAYGQAQAYEQKKAKFLHEMTERMAAPVERVCRATDNICQNYARLSETDMKASETDIRQATDEIVELLDQLIKEPADA